MADDIEINDALTIPAAELWFTVSRSSGPGGQNVNKVSSRVSLHFDVAGSPTLSDDQRRRIASRLATRVNRDGVLSLHVQLHRSQATNRIEALERFAVLLREALKRRTPRRKTRKPRSANRRRLEQKKRRGDLKRTRSRSSGDD